jgi:hypothetical protein
MPIAGPPLAEPEPKERTMQRRTRQQLDMLRALPRIVFLTAVLFAPLIAIQSVQAGADSIIESSAQRTSGAGFVIVAGLRRS